MSRPDPALDPRNDQAGLPRPLALAGAIFGVMFAACGLFALAQVIGDPGPFAALSPRSAAGRLAEALARPADPPPGPDADAVVRRETWCPPPGLRAVLDRRDVIPAPDAAVNRRDDGLVPIPTAIPAALRGVLLVRLPGLDRLPAADVNAALDRAMAAIPGDVAIGSAQLVPLPGGGDGFLVVAWNRIGPADVPPGPPPAYEVGPAVRRPDGSLVAPTPALDLPEPPLLPHPDEAPPEPTGKAATSPPGRKGRPS